MTHNFSNTPTNCGTYAGYSSHVKLKQSPCDLCTDARNAYRRSYYKQHPEKKRAQDLRYLATHPGQRDKYDAKYREHNREKTRAASLRWNKEHPERMRIASRKRRALKLGNGSETYTEEQIFNLHGTTCYLCKNAIDLLAPRSIGKQEGWELGLHIDHVVPIIAGGPDTLENVRPAHAICNMRKGSKMSDDFEVELDPSLFEDEGVELDDLDYDKHALDEEDLEEEDDYGSEES